MPDTPLGELDAFLAAHPEVRFVDAFLNDLNTVERGKRIDRAGLGRLFETGLLLPGSMFALDALGGTSEATGLGFDDGDADRPCRPIPGTLVPVPWLREDGVAQLQLSMHEPDGRAFFGDPRHVLAKVLDRFHRLNLTPVVAIEYEFYFVDLQRGPDGLPRPPAGPLTGRRDYRTQINSMADLTEYSPLLAAIDAACQAQGVPATTALAEYGPGQYEVNLAHQPDALAACDQALRFKRIVKSVARAHGCEATFLAKPYRDMAGSGLHVHASLLDAGGRNLFACDDPAQCADLRHAIRGLLDTPRRGHGDLRARPELLPPLPARGLRADDPVLVGQQPRLGDPHPRQRRGQPPHRAPLAGADANPYLVVAWMLAGIHRGLSRGAEPPPALSGNAYRQADAEPLPTHWATALERFRASDFAREYLGRPFAQLYAVVKQAELDDFNTYVSPLEIEWYLGPL
jgi:glutamine synthetase